MLVFFTNLSLLELHLRYLALFFLFSAIGCFGWFWMGNLHKNIQLVLEFNKSPFLILYFSYYTLMAFLMLSVILLSILIKLLYTRNDQPYDLWQQLKLVSEFESELWDTGLGEEVACCSNARKTPLVLLTSLKTSVLLMWKWVDLFLRKSNLLRCWGWLKLDWGFYIIPIANTASKKSGILSGSMKFLSSEVALCH